MTQLQEALTELKDRIDTFQRSIDDIRVKTQILEEKRDTLEDYYEYLINLTKVERPF